MEIPELCTRFDMTDVSDIKRGTAAHGHSSTRGEVGEVVSWTIACSIALLHHTPALLLSISREVVPETK